MKNRLQLGLAATLTLLICGCKMPTDPLFAPDGRTAVHESNGRLMLRSGTSDRVLSEQIQGSVAFSADGAKLAFSDNDGTVILDLRSGARVTAKDIYFPYAWIPAGLAATRNLTAKDGDVVLVDPASGAILSDAQLPIRPHWAAPAGIDGALFGDSDETYSFDGLSARRMRGLDGLDAVTYAPGGNRWTFARKSAPKGGAIHQIELLSWVPGMAGGPVHVENINLPVGRADVLYALDVEGARDGTLAVTVVRMYAPPADRNNALRLIQKYDLLNNIADMRPSTADERAINGIIERARWQVIALARRPGGAWREIAATQPARIKQADFIRIALAPDGSRLGLDSDKGFRIIQLR